MFGCFPVLFRNSTDFHKNMFRKFLQISPRNFSELQKINSVRAFDSVIAWRCSSTVTETGQRSVQASDGGHEVERLKDSRPVANVPFAKELFLGRYDKVLNQLTFCTMHQWKFPKFSS